MDNQDIGSSKVGTAIIVHSAIKVLEVNINENLEELEEEVIEKKVQEDYMRKNRVCRQKSRKLCPQSEC